MGGKKWTDEQIEDLLDQAKKILRTEIPLADEVRRYQHFIFQMYSFACPGDSFKFKVTKVVFSFWHGQRTRPEEIEIPEEIAWKTFHEAREILDDKCDELKGLLGGKYVMRKSLFAK